MLRKFDPPDRVIINGDSIRYTTVNVEEPYKQVYEEQWGLSLDEDIYYDSGLAYVEIYHK